MAAGEGGGAQSGEAGAVCIIADRLLRLGSPCIMQLVVLIFAATIAIAYTLAYHTYLQYRLTVIIQIEDCKKCNISVDVTIHITV